MLSDKTAASDNAHEDIIAEERHLKNKKCMKFSEKKVNILEFVGWMLETEFMVSIMMRKQLQREFFSVGLCEQAEWSALYGKLASQGEKD